MKNMEGFQILKSFLKNYESQFLNFVFVSFWFANIYQ